MRDLRDRALIATLTYSFARITASFARITAALNMKKYDWPPLSGSTSNVSAMTASMLARAV